MKSISNFLGKELKCLIFKRRFSVQANSSQIEAVDLSFSEILANSHKESAIKKSTGIPRKMIVVHGLLGNKNNLRPAALTVSRHCYIDTYLVDLRNHGESPHSDVMSVDALSKDLEALVKKNQLSKVSLLGHSAGGRAAMKFALEHPNLVDRLVVVDVAPYSQIPSKTLLNYIKIMKEINLEKVQSRRDADEQIRHHIPDYTLRQFLLTNLSSEGTTYKWRLNLNAIEKFLLNTQNPHYKQDSKFEGKALFVGGSKSDYRIFDYKQDILQFFPKAKIETLDGAGHWVHTDRPRVFSDKIVDFMNKDIE